MLGYHREKYGCFIRNIEKDIAYVDIIDENGETSFMDISLKDLLSSRIQPKVGTIFQFIHTTFLNWEKIVFKKVPKKIATNKEIQKMLKDYEEKYGDV